MKRYLGEPREILFDYETNFSNKFINILQRNARGVSITIGPTETLSISTQVSSIGRYLKYRPYLDFSKIEQNKIRSLMPKVVCTITCAGNLTFPCCVVSVSRVK